MPHWISVQRSPHAFSTNDFKLLVLLVTLLGSIYNKCSATISILGEKSHNKNKTTFKLTFESTSQSRVHKTIKNDDVILCLYRTLPCSFGFSGVYRKNTVDNVFVSKFSFATNVSGLIS